MLGCEQRQVPILKAPAHPTQQESVQQLAGPVMRNSGSLTQDISAAGYTGLQQ
jgi:hypothetical protein